MLLVVVCCVRAHLCVNADGNDRTLSQRLENVAAAVAAWLHTQPNHVLVLDECAVPPSIVNAIRVRRSGHLIVLAPVTGSAASTSTSTELVTPLMSVDDARSMFAHVAGLAEDEAAAAVTTRAVQWLREYAGGTVAPRTLRLLAHVVAQVLGHSDESAVHVAGCDQLEGEARAVCGVLHVLNEWPVEAVGQVRAQATHMYCTHLDAYRSPHCYYSCL